MSSELNQLEPRPSQMPTEQPSDEASQASSPDQDLIAQTHRLAGQHALTQLFKSGFLQQSQEPESDRAATMLSNPDYSKKSKSAMRTSANDKLTLHLNKLLEDMGKNPPPTDAKGIERLLGRTQMKLMKMPGFAKMKGEDKKALTHRILQLASNGETEDLHEIMEHEASHGKSRDRIKAKVAGLFGSDYPKEPGIDEKERDRVKEYVDGNEHMKQAENQTMMAEGGEVTKPLTPDRVATAYPEQAVVNGASKARVHAYLNSVKPQKNMGLPFDKDLPEPHKDREYKKAVDMAARPLSILDEVKDGSISPSTFSHFAKMHPEIHDLLKKKITDHIIGMQASDSKRPPAHVRQALSLFMQNPMEKGMTQPMIAAAQAVFIPKPPPQQGPQGKSKGSPSKLKDKGAKAYLTPDQASQMDHTAGRAKD